MSFIDTKEPEQPAFNRCDVKGPLYLTAIKRMCWLKKTKPIHSKTLRQWRATETPIVSFNYRYNHSICYWLVYEGITGNQTILTKKKTKFKQKSKSYYFSNFYSQIGTTVQWKKMYTSKQYWNYYIENFYN